MKWVWFAVAALCVLAEFGLRRAPTLPSLSAVMVPFAPVGRPAVRALQEDSEACIETDTNSEPPTAWAWMAGSGDGVPLKLLVAGDSMALGQGVRPAETWAVGLGERLSMTTERRVEVINAGVNAAGYCGVIRSVHHHLAHERFDAVVVSLFADDLEQRAVELAGGEVSINPALIGGPVGWAAGQSYVFNWVWLQIVKRAVAQATAEGTVPPEHVVRAGRQVPAQTVENLRLAIARLAEHVDLWILNSPAGIDRCGASPSPGSECDWLLSDMDLIADQLISTKVSWVDNRALFSGQRSRFTLRVEEGWFKQEGRLPIHPNPAGHQRILESVSSAVLSPLSSP
jgi:lysophospholipase L1-like esterase